MSSNFSDTVVVPVANREDAAATAAVIEPYSFGEITVLYVVEKGEGVPDKMPVEQAESIAADAFARFKASFPEAKTEITYRRDVVDAITDVAEEVDASAIVFRPRGGGRILQFLAGDLSLRLITESDRPVIAIRGETDQ